MFRVIKKSSSEIFHKKQKSVKRNKNQNQKQKIKN